MVEKVEVSPNMNMKIVEVVVENRSAWIRVDLRSGVIVEYEFQYDKIDDLRALVDWAKDYDYISEEECHCIGKNRGGSRYIISKYFNREYF
jgi:hypothetical protein